MTQARRVRSTAIAIAIAVAVMALVAGCRSDDEQVVVGKPGPRAGASASARPLDRLAPGELAAGDAVAFGFTIPRQMRVERRFVGEVHAAGNVSATALVEYVRQRVTAAHMELAGHSTIIDKARIVGGDASKLYRFEVIRDGVRARLVVSDITPPPTIPGLSDEERWKRTGLTPDGKILDLKKLE